MSSGSEAHHDHPRFLAAVDCTGKYYVDFTRRELQVLLGQSSPGGPRVAHGRLGEAQVTHVSVSSSDGPSAAQLARLPAEATSPENLALVEKPELREDHEACRAVLSRWGLDANMPSPEEALAMTKRFGDPALDAMRRECRDIRLVVAALMTGADFARLHDSGEIRRHDSTSDFFHGAALYPQLKPGQRPFSVGLVEGSPDLPFLEDPERNPDHQGGVYYDNCRSDLASLGLRLPRGHEYIVLAKILKGRGISLDSEDSSLLDRGERPSKASPLPVGATPEEISLWIESGAAYTLRRRPSLWATFI